MNCGRPSVSLKLCKFSELKRPSFEHFRRKFNQCVDRESCKYVLLKVSDIFRELVEKGINPIYVGWMVYFLLRVFESLGSFLCLKNEVIAVFSDRDSEPLGKHIQITTA